MTRSKKQQQSFLPISSTGSSVAVTGKEPSSGSWNVLVCGLPLADESFELGSSLKLRRIKSPLSIFDVAAAGAEGFREWATLEPFASIVTAEIDSPVSAATLPGYDALNKCWLVSALLVIRGFARHICPAVSGYSWNFIAGHQKRSSSTSKQQLIEEGPEKAIFESRYRLSPFQGGLLDYHLKLLIPKNTKSNAFDASEAAWFSEHFSRFNKLAADDERFRFALEAAIDWRYSKDPRAAVARLWAGVESLLGIGAELVYRVSLSTAAIIAPRGPERILAFKNTKTLYGIRSKAVHGEPLTDEKLFTGLHESFEVLRMLLLDAVERGAIRTEEDVYSELLT
jgi:hypothetical protein